MFEMLNCQLSFAMSICLIAVSYREVKFEQQLCEKHRNINKGNNWDWLCQIVTWDSV